MEEQAKKQPKLCVSPINGNSLKTLPKGVSGNPAGYSKARRERDEIRRWFDKNMPDLPEKVLRHLATKATSKDFRYMQEFLDRYFGKVPQKKDEDNLGIAEQNINQNLAYKRRMEAVECEVTDVTELEKND